MFNGKRLHRLAASAIVFLTAGCSQSKPVVSPPLRFVRVNALLSSDPAWRQIQNLHRADRAALPLPTSFQPPPFPAMPPDFRAPKTLLPSLAKERQQRLQEDIARYIERLRQSLRAAYALRYERYKQELQSALEATLAKLTAAWRAELEQEAQARVEIFDRKIRRLEWRNVALITQIKAFLGQSKLDALSQQKIVLAQMAALQDQRAAALEYVGQSLKEKQDAERALLESDLKKQLADYRKQLNVSIEQKAGQAAQEQALRARSTASLPPGPEVTASKQTAGETPLPLPPFPHEGAAFTTALHSADAGKAQSSIEMAAMEKSLLALIQQDVKRAAQQLALEKGWKLVSPSTPGAKDATSQVSAFLRAGRSSQ